VRRRSGSGRKPTLVLDGGGQEGAIKVGQLADLAVLSADYMSIPEEEIGGLESVLTLLGGEVVYGAAEFARLAPSPPPVLPDWSPVKTFGGYRAAGERAATLSALGRETAATCGCGTACGVHGHAHAQAWASEVPTSDPKSFWGALGCACWAV
jgi:hypothetical protein